MKVKTIVYGVLIPTLSMTLLSGCNSNETLKQDVVESETMIEDQLIRNTKYGKVKGVNEEEVQVYYGIPYAQQPTGDLRWHAPKELEKWDHILTCDEETEIVMQMQTVDDGNGNSITEPRGTADALTLDVYTKEDAEKLPVLVYIHGGNNQSGSSLDIRGNEIVEKDGVVYVSINYRLGLLGFNSLPALLDEENNTGNFTLLDIAAALKWVKENIDSFGGDAENITVSGFSAGGRNVMAMLVSPLFEGLFDKAIVYSGGMTIADQEESTNVIAQIIAPLAVEDKKANSLEEATKWLLTDEPTVKDYLYSISDERLTSLMTDAGIRMSVFPHLFGDDIVLPSTGFANAEYVNDVPLIMLTGTTEFSGFVLSDSYLAGLGDEQQLATDFVINHGSDLYGIFNTQLSAQKMSSTYQSDIYLAQVNYGGANSLTKIDTLGSFHGIFVPMLTERTGYDKYHDFSNKEYSDLSEAFHCYLKNFLYTSNPNGEDVDIEWSEWNTDSRLTLVLDASQEHSEVTVQNVYQTAEDIIENINNDKTLSEEMKLGVIKNVMNGRWFSTELDQVFSTKTKVTLK